MDAGAMAQLLGECPVIAAVKDDKGLQKALAGSAGVVFVLYGTVTDIPGTVRQIKAAGKAAVVHLDLIDGLAAREVAVDYLASNTQADGVISTKTGLVRRARELGLVGIRRFFLLDSLALETMRAQLAQHPADFIEVLPGTMPKVLRRVAGLSPLPFIAGGLIADKEDVVAALSAGALAVSTSSPALWEV